MDYEGEMVFAGYRIHFPKLFVKWALLLFLSVLLLLRLRRILLPKKLG
jgi:hypothetical protein